MKILMALLGLMSTYALAIAQTASEVIPPVVTLVGLVGLIIKYMRDHTVENDQHDHYERFIDTQREHYELTLSNLRQENHDLRMALNKCREGKL